MQLRSGNNYILKKNKKLITNNIGYYIKHFNFAKNKEEQVEIVLKLFYYLYYNFNFLKEHEIFYYVALKKFCEIYTENKFLLGKNSNLWLGIDNYIKKFFDKDYDDISLKILKYKIFTHDFSKNYCNNHMLCQCYECKYKQINVNPLKHIDDINTNLHYIKLINKRITFKTTTLQDLCFNKIKDQVKKSKFDKLKTLKYIKKLNFTYFFKENLIKDLYPEIYEPIKTRNTETNYFY